jgi:hypothetical protein
MPITYHCDTCGTEATSLDGWLVVSVQFISYAPGMPNPPGGRTLNATAPDLLFHASECRKAWCEGAKVAEPT